LFFYFEFSKNNIAFRYLQGDEVESIWRGALSNVTYRYGGELRDSA
jgi:hypothetical protein